VSKTTIFANHRFLIIGGATKAGTTSVFNYLANHPEICATGVKETRFFLDADYPLPSKLRYSNDGPAAYLSFFDNAGSANENRWKLEATPDYLYSQGTAGLIRETLDNACFIFLLREPVSRLLSFYRFGQQRNEIAPTMSFDEYVELQKANSAADFLHTLSHPAFCALQHGRYSRYLERFLQLFGRPAIYVAFYEQLQADPDELMMSICRSAGIDETYFKGRSFDVINKSVKLRSPRFNRVYVEAREKARLLVRHRPRLRAILRGVGRKVNEVYRGMNVVKHAEVVISPSTQEFLSAYYQGEAGRLKQMLGIDVPWHKCSDAVGNSARVQGHDTSEHCTIASRQ
jgi:hypothetical protein